jgi:hypothetical protein
MCIYKLSKTAVLEQWTTDTTAVTLERRYVCCRRPTLILAFCLGTLLKLDLRKVKEGRNKDWILGLLKQWKFERQSTKNKKVVGKKKEIQKYAKGSP